MIVKIIKYIKEHSAIFDVNMCNNNELDFDVANKNNIYFAYLNFTINCTQFILDFEATTHICCKKTYFSKLNPTNIYIAWGKASKIKASEIGKVLIIFHDTFKKAILKNCLYVSKTNINLISINKLLNN